MVRVRFSVQFPVFVLLMDVSKYFYTEKFLLCEIIVLFSGLFEVIVCSNLIHFTFKNIWPFILSIVLHLKFWCTKSNQPQPSNNHLLRQISCHLFSRPLIGSFTNSFFKLLKAAIIIDEETWPSILKVECCGFLDIKSGVLLFCCRFRNFRSHTQINHAWYNNNNIKVEQNHLRYINKNIKTYLLTKNTISEKKNYIPILKIYYDAKALILLRCFRYLSFITFR